MENSHTTSNKKKVNNRDLTGSVLHEEVSISIIKNDLIISVRLVGLRLFNVGGRVRWLIDLLKR